MAANQELKSLWFGPAGATIGSSSEDTLFYPGELGKTAFMKPSDDKPVPVEAQKVKRYASDTVTAAAGDVAFWQDLDDCVVTNDVTAAIGASTNPLVAGVFGGAHPQAGKFGTIQVGGVVDLTVASSTVAVGDPVVAHTSGCNVVAQATSPATTAAPKIYIGRALAAGSTTVKAKVILTLPRFGR
jgi:hypothetical protein